MVVNDPTRICTRELIALRHLSRLINLKNFSAGSNAPGSTTSLAKGRGLEFDEVRNYQFGDDIRALDWKVTARMGKPHTKTFLEEKERQVLFCIDLRNTMFFATRGLFKAVSAARLSALLAWGASDHDSRIGGLLFSEDSCIEVGPKRGRRAALTLIQTLVHHPAWSVTAPKGDRENDIQSVFSRLCRQAIPGSQIFLVSDLRRMRPHAEASLQHLARHCRVSVFFVYDRLEAELPQAGRYPICNNSLFLTIDTSSDFHRRTYRQAFEERLSYWQNFCRRFSINFHSFSSERDPIELLISQR